ncbi:MAG: GAF domain-containing protein [Anaerolineae bacterium]
MEAQNIVDVGADARQSAASACCPEPGRGGGRALPEAGDIPQRDAAAGDSPPPSRWRDIIDSLDDELIVVDRDLRIKWANAAARRRLAKTPPASNALPLAQSPSKDDWVGKPCYLAGHKKRPCPLVAQNCPAVAVFDRGEPVRAICQHLSGDGSTRVVEIIASPLRDEQGQVCEVVKLSRDITEQHYLQTSLLKRNRELSALAVVSAAIGHSLNLKKILETALDEVLQLTGYDVGAIFVLRQRTEEPELVAYRGLSPEAAQAMSRLRLSQGACDGVVEARHPLVISDLAPYGGRIWGKLKQGNLRSMVHVPLIAKRSILGSLCVGTCKPHRFKEEEVSLLSAICSQIAVAVENARLYREVERKEQLRGKLLERVITAQEDERKRIARELHDDTSQSLTGLLYTLEEAAETIDPDELQDLLVRMQGISLQALEGVFNIIYDLRPSLLDHLGLCAALRSYAEKRLAPSVRVHLEQSGDVRRLPGPVETALFRVVQEAISNIAEHAGAGKVDISLDFRKRFVIVIVEDNGVGFDLDEVTRLPDGQRRGLGLLGMQERIELLGGDIRIASEPDVGTSLFISVPVESGEASSQASYKMDG